MSKITEVIVEPSKIYVNSTFLLKIKIEDDIKAKKYITTENNKKIIIEDGKTIITEWS